MIIKPFHLARWTRFSCAAIACAAVIAMSPVHAQERASDTRPAGSNPAVATDGATLIHGNYCGAGNRPGKPPIDALDLACMNHDACTPPSGIPDCDCNVRLRDEAAAVSLDPRQAPELQSLARLTAAAAAVMICKPTIEAAAPSAPAPAVAAPAASTPTAPTPVAPVALSPPTASPVTEGRAPLSIVPDTAVAAPTGPAPAVAVQDAPVRAAPVAEAPAGAPRRSSLP